jgi:hypothetical protein
VSSALLEITKQPNLTEEVSMKMKQLTVVCGLAVALLCSVGAVSAQDNGGGGGGGGGGGRYGGGGGNGGGPGGGGGGFGRGNFDPAAMQQRLLDNVRDQLGFTNDTDWSAVQPLVQKVMETRRDAQGPGMGRLFGRGGRGGGQGGNNRRGGGGGMFGNTSPEADALQKALDDDAPSGQVKDLLTKYETAQKGRLAKAKEAEEALRQVLTSKQEAQATLLGLLE